MKLVVVSHKRCWPEPDVPSGLATIGGFSFQIERLAELFDETTLVVPIQKTPRPAGTQPIRGERIRSVVLDEPSGSGWRRKAALVPWALPNLRTIWREVGKADAVHALVPGDIGTLGLIAARARRKPLFVRHCGTWGHAHTATDRFLARTLPKIADDPKETVVMATGGGRQPPEPQNPQNPAVSWIFSTTLDREEIDRLPQPRRWTAGDPLRIITVGRLTEGKNTRAALAAMPAIREQRPGATLDVVGGGPCFDSLLAQRADLGLDDSVRLHGNLDHERVMEVLAEGHLFVFPTRVAEGFPKAVIEALACGLPTIAPPVSVLADLIDGSNGRLLGETSAEEITDSVVEMTQDPDALHAAGVHARESARAFTLQAWRDTIGERLEAAWGPLRSKREDRERSDREQPEGELPNEGVAERPE